MTDYYEEWEDEEESTDDDFYGHHWDGWPDYDDLDYELYEPYVPTLRERIHDWLRVRVRRVQIDPFHRLRRCTNCGRRGCVEGEDRCPNCWIPF